LGKKNETNEKKKERKKERRRDLRMLARAFQFRVAFCANNNWRRGEQTERSGKESNDGDRRKRWQFEVAEGESKRTAEGLG
jgi:hypothetical protein